jgi:hypothetical protein
MNTNPRVIDWLLAGDPAICWQVQRDLLAANPESVAREQRLTETQGWGSELLNRQDPDGRWGGGIYSPKWISTTYSLLLLRRIGIPPDNNQVRHGCVLLLDSSLDADGGLNIHKRGTHSETCVTGMGLSLAAYFQIEDDRPHILAEHLLGQRLADGGWNCRSYEGDTHSSFHTTISVLEGLREYERHQPQQLEAIRTAQVKGREFLLQHRLFKSHRTGEVVDARMTRFSFPPRWRYDVLRALDYFQESEAAWDARLEEAVELLLKRRTADGRWLLQNRHSGRTFFEMEAVGQPSRWNTLRALRVLDWWEKVRPHG